MPRAWQSGMLCAAPWSGSKGILGASLTNRPNTLASFRASRWRRPRQPRRRAPAYEDRVRSGAAMPGVLCQGAGYWTLGPVPIRERVAGPKAASSIHRDLHRGGEDAVSADLDVRWGSSSHRRSCSVRADVACCVPVQRCRRSVSKVCSETRLGLDCIPNSPAAPELRSEVPMRSTASGQMDELPRPCLPECSAHERCVDTSKGSACVAVRELRVPEPMTVSRSGQVVPSDEGHQWPTSTARSDDRMVRTEGSGQARGQSPDAHRGEFRCPHRI